MATTFYLKHRPQNFQDLDSTEARVELEKIFKSGQFPHAFLISGPRGIGKTSAARVVAKTVNCQEKKDFEPCNQCSSCRSITSGTCLDVIEIDAASNRGIDDIKELREKIKLAPASAKYKVYIIDEVHMLTTEAFNALLKTLEEPPEHALFILCTTDPEKLPKTIISRCQRINFKRAKKTEIIPKLEKICQTEAFEYEKEALEEIAKLSDGSFRDAVKILGQVALSGKITLSAVVETAGILSEFNPEEFLKILAQKKTKEALTWIDKAVEQGVNLRLLLENLLEKLRLVLLSNFGVEEDSSAVKEISLNPTEVRILIELFSRAYFELKNAVIPQLPLEMAIIEWASMDDKKDVSSQETKKEKPPEGNGEAKASSTASSPLQVEEVKARWSEILEKVKPLNHSVQAFLRASRPLACEGEFLILEVFYKFHKDQLETEKCRRIFEQAASSVLGFPVKLKCSLAEKKEETSLVDKIQTSASPLASEEDDDIISFAEEIFNKGGSLQ
ncbi:MAG TPA: DNA polymerase III subunit gamma/tau [Clostridia bacterium]|nr:DNA polymerase III subunit gamma/tau [Clostridia bacterium]